MLAARISYSGNELLLVFCLVALESAHILSSELVEVLTWVASGLLRSFPTPGPVTTSLSGEWTDLLNPLAEADLYSPCRWFWLVRFEATSWVAGPCLRGDTDDILLID